MISSSQEVSLDCSICFGLFNNPYDTPCKHTFCKDCISAWIERNNASCPLCRNNITIQSLSENRDARLAVEAVAKKAQEASKELLASMDFPTLESAVAGLKAYYFTTCAENKRNWSVEGTLKGRKFSYMDGYDPKTANLNPALLKKMKEFEKLGMSVMLTHNNVSMSQVKIVFHTRAKDQEENRLPMSLITALGKAGITAIAQYSETIGKI